MSVNVKDEINRYISSNETVGAMMVTGNWGSGKSCLVKQIADEQNKSEEKEYAMVEVSLFGIDSIDTLTKMVNKSVCSVIALSKNDDKTKERTGKLFGVLKTLTNELKEASKVVDGFDKIINLNPFDFIELSDTVTFLGETSPRRLVLIFDDFERCDCPITSLLGVINEYTENKGIKTIIVSDEKKIEDEVYTEFKEKVIFRTVKLSSDYAKIINYIVSSYVETATGYKQFLIDNEAVILEAFVHSGYNNIRTVRATVVDFERVYEAWEKSGVSNKELSFILYQFFAIVAEYKAGNYCKFDKYHSYVINARIEDPQDEEKRDEVQDEANREVKEKYRNDTFSNFSKTLSKWIVEGDWDEGLFIDEIQRRYGDNNLTNEQKFLLYKFFDLNKEIIDEGLPMILERAYQGEATCDELIALIQKVHGLRQNEANLPCEIDYLKIEEGFDKRLELIRKGIIEEPPKHTFTTNDYIDEEAISLNNKIENLDVKQEVWENYRNLRGYILKRSGTTPYKLSGIIIDVFDEDLLSHFFEDYKISDNGRKRELARVILNLRISDKYYSSKEEITESITNLERLAEQLNTLVPIETDTISAIILRKFIKELGDKVEEMKADNQ